MNRHVLIFCFVLSTVFAAVSTTDTPTLYSTENRDPSFSLQSDMVFNHEISAQTNARILSGSFQDGNVVMCPGDVIFESALSGTFSSPGFYAFYPYNNDFCAPARYSGSTPTNIPIRWNKNDYDFYRDAPTCQSNFACWGREGSFTNHKVDVYLSTSRYENRIGQVAAVCAGRDNLNVQLDNRNFASDQQDAAGSTLSRSLSFQNPGTYLIDSQFAVQGCDLIVRQPSCGRLPDREVIYSRTASQLGTGAPQYGRALPSQRITATVSNPRSQLDVARITPSTIQVDSATGRGFATIRVRNSGDVPVTVTGVSASSGFIARPSLSFCDPFSRVCVINGFNAQIAPNTERDLSVEITAQRPLPAQVVLSFNYRNDAPTCAANQPEIKTVATPPTEVRRRPGNGNGGTPGFQCALTGPATVTLNQPVSYNIRCTQNNNPATCPAVVWRMENVQHAISSQSDREATFVVQNGAQGRVVATSSSVSCSLQFTTTPGGPGGDSNQCVITGPASIRPNMPSTFSIACSRGNQPISCGNIAWSASGLTNSRVSNQNQNNADVTASSGSGQLIATVNNQFSCVRAVAVTSGGNGGSDPPPGGRRGRTGDVGCILEPASQFLKPGSLFSLTARCGTDLNQECTGLSWSNFESIAIPGTVRQTGSALSFVTKTVVSSEQIITASGGTASNPIRCTAVANVGQFSCRDFA